MNSVKESSVSIIIPIYNVEKYILECLKSLEKQTYINFEIILVNDGTLDHSVKVAEEYLVTTSMNYRFISQENKGLPAARNTGIKSAKGDYICYLDSDDIYEQHHIELLYHALKNSDVDFAFTSFEVTGIKDRYGKPCDNYNYKVLASNEIRNKFLDRSLPIHCCSIMIRKDFLEKNNLYFNETLKFGEDVEYLWRLLAEVNQCAYYDSKSYKYLRRPNSLMTNQNIERIKVFICQFERTICGLSYDEGFKQKILSRVFFGICHSCAKNSSYSVFRNLIQETDIVSRVDGVEHIKDYRVSIMYCILKQFPRIFWAICRIV